VISGVGAISRRVPLVSVAWRLRFVVGVVAVIQSAAQGRITSAVAVAVFLTASYATPAARRAHGARLQVAADRYVCTRGLGPSLLSAMYRTGVPQPDISRTNRLRSGAGVAAAGGSQTRPALRLVSS
jgi:hypothetical protein